MSKTRIQNIDDPSIELYINGDAYSVGDVLRIDGSPCAGRYIVISIGGTETLENREQRRSKQFKRKNKFERVPPMTSLRR